MYQNLLDFINKFSISAESRSESTSAHYINGDNNLNQTETFLYLLLNHMNNVDHIDVDLYKNIFNNSVINDFKIDESTLRKIWDNIDQKASPSRKVGDIFWSQLKWSDYKDIKILDVGCRSGNYVKKIYGWSN